MRVFIRKNSNGEFPSVNFANAYFGFKELGWEIVFYQSINDINPTREDVVVDYVDQSREIFRRLGREYPEICYPREFLLDLFWCRRIWETTVDTVSTNPDSWPVFIKPKGLKTFTGRVVKELKDFRGTRLRDEDTPIWASDPIDILAEWRCFVRYKMVVGVKQYAGRWSLNPDDTFILNAVDVYRSIPAGCALDFGLIKGGRTVLIEVNEGYSLGSYGLSPTNYAKLLTARWSEIMGVEDPLRDLKIWV